MREPTSSSRAWFFGRPRPAFLALPITAFLAALSACGDRATLLAAEDTGANPTLPQPVKRLIPTVNIAPAKGWPAGGMPTPMAGMAVTSFADKLDHPRWVYVLPNGDVLVAESNAPPKPEDGKGIKGAVMKMVIGPPGRSITLLGAAVMLVSPVL